MPLYGRYNDKSFTTTFNSSLLNLLADRYHLSVILAARASRWRAENIAIKATHQIRMSRLGHKACFEESLGIK